MLEKLKKKEKTLGDMDFEAKQNLVGFFDLLLKIDQRINPQNYQKYDDIRDTNNSD